MPQPIDCQQNKTKTTKADDDDDNSNDEDERCTHGIVFELIEFLFIYFFVVFVVLRLIFGVSSCVRHRHRRLDTYISFN